MAGSDQTWQPRQARVSTAGSDTELDLDPDFNRSPEEDEERRFKEIMTAEMSLDN